jgi:hypothetical protein
MYLRSNFEQLSPSPFVNSPLYLGSTPMPLYPPGKVYNTILNQGVNLVLPTPKTPVASISSPPISSPTSSGMTTPSPPMLTISNPPTITQTGSGPVKPKSKIAKDPELETYGMMSFTMTEDVPISIPKSPIVKRGSSGMMADSASLGPGNLSLKSIIPKDPELHAYGMMSFAMAEDVAIPIPKSPTPASLRLTSPGPTSSGMKRGSSGMMENSTSSGLTSSGLTSSGPTSSGMLLNRTSSDILNFNIVRPGSLT